MAKNGRGLICLALSKKQVEKLSLPLMSAVNKARMQTAFTVSIEARKGITTGISAFDRAKTIKVAINSRVKKKDIVLDIASNDATLLNFYNQGYNLVGYEPAQNILKIEHQFTSLMLILPPMQNWLR